MKDYFMIGDLFHWKKDSGRILIEKVTDQPVIGV